MYDEILDVVDVNFFPTERAGYTLPPGIYEIFDIDRTLECLLSDFVKVSITLDDIRLRSNLNINQTLIFTEKSFFSVQYSDLLNRILNH